MHRNPERKVCFSRAASSPIILHNESLVWRVKCSALWHDFTPFFLTRKDNKRWKESRKQLNLNRMCGWEAFRANSCIEFRRLSSDSKDFCWDSRSLASQCRIFPGSRFFSMSWHFEAFSLFRSSTVPPKNIVISRQWKTSTNPPTARKLLCQR